MDRYIKIDPCVINGGNIYLPVDKHSDMDIVVILHLLVIASLFKGEYAFIKIHPKILKKVIYFIDIIQALGIKVNIIDDIIYTYNEREELFGDYEFNVSKCPNIVTALIALGIYVNGTFIINGISEDSQAKEMIPELIKLGVDITPICTHNIYNGFVINGKSKYLGGKIISNCKNSLLFMMFCVISLKMQNANQIVACINGKELLASFFEEINKLKLQADTKDFWYEFEV